MHERTLRESNEERSKRLGVITNSKQPEPVRVGLSVSIKTEETPRPNKDASFNFSVLGSPCIVKYFSDYKYLEAITDPEEYHHDPRRWVDVFFKGERYGYAWNEGRWTHSADLLKEKEQIEYMICQHFGTLLPPIQPGDIETSKRQSFDGKYLIFGRTSSFVVSATFKHKGYVVDLDIIGRKGRYDARNSTIQVPIKAKPTSEAIAAWLSKEYAILNPLKGELPKI